MIETFVTNQRAKKKPVKSLLNFCGLNDIIRPLPYILNFLEKAFSIDFCGFSLKF
jgi:hypothetical protein